MKVKIELKDIKLVLLLDSVVHKKSLRSCISVLSFLSRSSYSFVVYFDNTPQRQLCYKLQMNKWLHLKSQLTLLTIFVLSESWILPVWGGVKSTIKGLEDANVDNIALLVTCKHKQIKYSEESKQEANLFTLINTYFYTKHEHYRLALHLYVLSI